MLLHPRNRDPAFLITAAGTNAGFAAAQALRKVLSTKAKVVVADTSPPFLVPASCLADHTIQLPPVSAPEYFPALEQTFDRFGITHYFPILDEEILEASLLATAGTLWGAQYIGPSHQVVLTANDKLLTYEWLKRSGLPTPETWIAATAPAIAGLIQKPRKGRGSAGFSPWPTKGQDSAKCGDGECTLVQQQCAPPELTVDVFNAPESCKVWSAARERLEVKAGVCTKARVFQDALIHELAERIATELEVEGLFCFQLMELNGRKVITDLNPRPGAGTAISVAAGYDFYSALFKRALGLEFDSCFSPVSSETIVVRQYSEIVTSIN